MNHSFNIKTTMIDEPDASVSNVIIHVLDIDEYVK